MDDYFKICIHGKLKEKSNEQVEIIVKQADIFFRDENGRTGLFLAAWNGHVHILQKIQQLHINKNIPINILDDLQCSPVSVAVSRYLMEVFSRSTLPTFQEEVTTPLQVAKSHFGCDGSDEKSDWLACINFLLNFPLIQTDACIAAATIESCNETNYDNEGQAENMYKLISLMARHPNITFTKTELKYFVMYACKRDRPEYLALFLANEDNHNTISFNSTLAILYENENEYKYESIFGYCLMRLREQCVLWLLGQPDCDPNKVLHFNQHNQSVFEAMCHVYKTASQKHRWENVFIKWLQHPMVNKDKVSWKYGSTLIHITAKYGCAELLVLTLKNTNFDINLLQQIPNHPLQPANWTALQLSMRRNCNKTTTVLLKDPRTHIPVPDQILSDGIFCINPSSIWPLLTAGYDPNLDAFVYKDSNRYHNCILNSADMLIDYAVFTSRKKEVLPKGQFPDAEMVTVARMFHSAGARVKTNSFIRQSYLSSINQDQIQMYNTLMDIYKNPLSLTLLSRNLLVSRLKAVHCPGGSLLAHSNKIQKGIDGKLPDTLIYLLLNFSEIAVKNE